MTTSPLGSELKIREKTLLELNKLLLVMAESKATTAPTFSESISSFIAAIQYNNLRVNAATSNTERAKAYFKLLELVFGCLHTIATASIDGELTHDEYSSFINKFRESAITESFKTTPLYPLAKVLLFLDDVTSNKKPPTANPQG